MARWQPGARERLRSAAMDLYVTQGFEKTTVADIAASVGLTERTFFRHFADKREVLFHGQEILANLFVQGVADAPAGSMPLEAVAAALEAVAEFFPDDQRSFSVRRQKVIAENPALQERELLKLAGLAMAVSAALEARGVSGPAARLAAESGVTVFGVTFEQWISDGEQRSFHDIGRGVLDELVTMALGHLRDEER